MISTNARTLAATKKLQTSVRAEIRAVIGNPLTGDVTYTGQSLYAPSNENVYAVRLKDGLSDGGIAGPGKSVPMYGTQGIRVEYGVPVKVIKIADNAYLYSALDLDACERQNIDPRTYLDTSNAAANTWRRTIWTGKHYPDIDSNGDTTQKLRSYGYAHIGFDGARKNWSAGSGNALDFSADFPSATEERYVLTYYNPVLSVSGYVATTTQTAINDYVQSPTTYVDPLIALLPHQLCQPREIWRLDGNAGVLAQPGFKDDLRELFSAPQPSSFPTTLSRNWIIPSGHQQLIDCTQAPITLNDDTCITLGDNAQLISINDKTIGGAVADIASGGKPALREAYTITTSNYTVTDEDGTIEVDASGGARTITLLDTADVRPGRMYQIIAADVSGGIVTVATTASQTISGSATQIINVQWNSITVVSNGTNWRIV